LGAKPPSSPTAVEALLLQHLLERVVDLDAPRSASPKSSKPHGDHELLEVDVLSACLPPLRMFIIGTGSVCAPVPPR
jgi:hypothetical protein